ncbi:MAG: extracellular solute-binding protein [Planctomycetes bacterium]|nr:extracellular solute-binding protein [Planctomycetota bacterium]
MSRWMETALLAILGIFVVVFMTMAWKSAGGPEAVPGGAAQLAVISPHWEGIRYEFEHAFEQHWNGTHPENPVDLTWLSPGGTSQIVRFIESEFTKNPDGIGVDVIFGGGVAPYEYFKEKGFFERIVLPQDTMAQIPPVIGGVRMYDIEHRWFGAAISGFGIVCNHRVLQIINRSAPRTWEDLANPIYMDWIASGDPRSSGSVHMLYEVILQAYEFEKGYQILCGMAGNIRAFDEGGNATPRAVGMGEAAAGGSIDFYAAEQVDAYGPQNIGFSMPRDLSVLSADPIAVLKGAPNHEHATAFVQFVMSEEGQKLWYVTKGKPGGPVMFGLNRYPVLKNLYDAGLPTAVSGNPYEFRTELRFDADKSSARWRILNDLLKATIFDVHSELRSAWRIVGPAGDTDLLKKFGECPVKEEDLAELARTKWRNPATRAAVMTEWTLFAKEKFRTIRKGVQ